MVDSTSASPRSSAKRQIIISAIVLVVAAATLYISINLVTSVPTNGRNWLHPLSFLGLAPATLVGTFAFIGVWWGVALLRSEKVSYLHPGAVVFSSSLTNDLRAVSDKLLGSRVLAERFTTGFTVSFDVDGLSVWRGIPGRPRRTMNIPWEQMGDVSSGIVHDLSRNAYGILVTYLASKEGSYVIAFAALGSGITHVFRLSELKTDDLLRRVFEKRPS